MSLYSVIHIQTPPQCMHTYISEIDHQITFSFIFSFYYLKSDSLTRVVFESIASFINVLGGRYDDLNMCIISLLGCTRGGKTFS